MSSKNPSLIYGLLTEKCPKCRRGTIFTQRSVFPLKTCLQVNEYCDQCNQKIKVENNFGQGMNFVFIVIVFILAAIVYALTAGLSFKDNSVFYYLGISVALSLVLQPWLMRFSRVLFLYLVTPFEKK